ncbi:NTP transferase domain-containing protein [Candidatus Woesebacteria bacterium]|nr:NTP transferase domain-containing protein [Candidatus Woesebacteria bacterium]
MKALLPVAGNGTRMHPLGVTTPKALIRILNKPLIEWTLQALVENHIDEVVIVISGGKFGSLIKEYVEKEIVAANTFPIKINFAVQEQQLGTAHVIQVAADQFAENEDFLFLYGDDLYGPANIAAVLAAPTLAVVGKEVADPEKWGIFQTNEAGDLDKVVEKPKEFVGNLANIGCMKLNSRIFKFYDQLAISVRGEYELTDSLQLLAHTEKISVIAAPDYWIPIGYPWHILDATEYFLGKQESKIAGEVSSTARVEGTLVLPKSSRVLDGCHLEGNIVVGENVVIGPGSRIRGNTVIGDNSHIGFSVEIKSCVLGNNVRIPHLAYVGDSIIGNDVNIAGGTMIANWRHDNQPISTPIKGQMVNTQRLKLGTIIGDHVRLGVNTSIYPGRKVWPNLTTSPGQIVDKDLTH